MTTIKKTVSVCLKPYQKKKRIVPNSFFENELVWAVTVLFDFIMAYPPTYLSK
jgi:hypothetical protein